MIKIHEENDGKFPDSTFWWKIFVKTRKSVYRTKINKYSCFGEMIVQWISFNGDDIQIVKISDEKEFLQIECRWNDYKFDTLKVFSTSREFADWIETLWIMNQ